LPSEATSPVAAIAVGEFGTVLIPQDAGKTWAVQPNITGKVLQAIVLEVAIEFGSGARRHFV
jgi:photosystem II stability/assembly factor-like uncharacterized protein